MIPKAWEVYPEEMGDFLLFVKTGGFFQRGDHRMISFGGETFFYHFFMIIKLKEGPLNTALHFFLLQKRFLMLI